MAFSILIVDDYKPLAKMLAKLLRSFGHEVFTAFSGTKALKMLSTRKSDIVFLDIDMPEMDGYEVARNIRKDSGFSKTVLVALTGHGQMGDKLKAREAGFDHHIEKPATLDEISRILKIYDF